MTPPAHRVGECMIELRERSDGLLSRGFDRMLGLSDVVLAGVEDFALLDGDEAARQPVAVCRPVERPDMRAGGTHRQRDSALGYGRCRHVALQSFRGKRGPLVRRRAR